MAIDRIGLKVLVVEDSKIVRTVLCKYLGQMEIQHIFVAENGQEAINIFRRENPDIVLLDGLLPDIDGFEVAKQIRDIEKMLFEIEGRKSWAPIIFLTSMDNDEDLARGIQAGGDDYLKKPVSLIVLKAKINAMRRLVEMQHDNAKITQQLNKAIRQLNEVNKELQIQSSTDKLTGISNRRMFDETLQKEWRRCERLKLPISLIMMDVDLFKQYNDTYGHQGGDRCLKAIAAQIDRSVQRSGDLAARYGGEEFALILGQTDAKGALFIANRTREYVSELKIKHPTSATQLVTISCGVASLVPDQHFAIADLIKAADDALYQAKKQGRNTVIFAEPR
jgi:diguanylate cyclase (GGDEF)-like protein